MIAKARAWTAAGWPDPASTSDRPRCAVRSFATAAAQRAGSPARGTNPPSGVDSPTARAISTARRTTSRAGSRKRWSAVAPVIVGQGSATYSRFIAEGLPASGTSRRMAKARASGICAGPSPRKFESRARMTSAFARSWIASTGSPKARVAPSRDVGDPAGSCWCQRASGNSPNNSPSWPTSVGEVIAPVRMRRPEPLRASWVSRTAVKAARASSNVLTRPLCRTTRERSGSYRLRISACVKGPAAPRLAGWSGFPSILVGRPSWLSTRTPVANPPRVIAVA